MSAGRSLLQLVGAVHAVMSRNLEPDGSADHEALAELFALLDSAEQRAAEAQAQQDETDGELWRFLLRATKEGTPESGVTAGLNEKYDALLAAAPGTPTIELFVAQLTEGLALFKAKAKH